MSTKILIRVIVFLIVLIATTVLYGWFSDNVTLTRIIPSLTPMNPVTATLFIISGITVWLLKNQATQTTIFNKLSLFILIGSVLIVTVGGVMFMKYILGIDLQIDRIFFASKLGVNRMAPATAAGFMIFGLAFFLLHLKTRVVVFIGQLCAITGGIIGFYALFAYIYNFVGVYGTTIFNPVAIHTATTFIFLSFGTLLIKPTEGLLNIFTEQGLVGSFFNNLSLNKKFFAGFAIIIFIAGLSSIYALVMIYKLEASQKKASRIAITSEKAFYLNAESLETFIAVDKYIDSRDPTLKDKINQSHTLTKTILGEIRDSNDSTQVDTLLDNYKKQLVQRELLINQILALAEINADVAEINRLSGESKILEEQSLVYLSTIINLEKAEVLQSQKNVQENMVILERSIGVVALLALSFTAFLSFLIANSIKYPIIKLIHIVDEMSKGNLDIRTNITSHDEVGTLARSFDQMAINLNKSQRDVLTKNQELSIKITELEKTKLASLNILEDLNNSNAKIQTDKAKDEAVLASIGDGMIAIDTNGIIMNTNSKAALMLGYNVSEMIGRNYFELWDMTDSQGKIIEPKQRPIFKALQGQTITSSDYQYYRRNKTLFPISVTVSPVLVNNKIIGVIDIFRDITHEKDVDRMKSEFISLASHQLRTPLSAMKWFSEMLLAGDAGALQPEQKEYIQNIYDSNERMVALVNALLNISRIESGRLIIEPHPTNLKKLLEQVITELKPKLEEKKMQLIVSVKEDLPEINVDTKLVQEVYINLLTNAIKYTPSGGEISVFISKKNNELISQISDNGMGIPVAQQDRVFMKFFRADNAIKTEGEGTGLGLYLIKAIVESSGGRIWFSSKEGTGTAFFFSLPILGFVTKKGEVSLNM